MLIGGIYNACNHHNMHISVFMYLFLHLFIYIHLFICVCLHAWLCASLSGGAEVTAASAGRPGPQLAATAYPCAHTIILSCISRQISVQSSPAVQSRESNRLLPLFHIVSNMLYGGSGCIKGGWAAWEEQAGVACAGRRGEYRSL